MKMELLNKNLFFWFCMLIYVSTAKAETAHYECAISQVLNQKFPLSIGDPPTQKAAAYLSSETSGFGKSIFQSAEQNEADSVAALYLGRKFKINRVTGEISSLDGIQSSGYMKHTVLKYGDNQNSFVLLIEGFKGVDGNQNYVFLEVAQYSVDKLKPFKAIGLGAGDATLLGNCEEN